jgi:putative addiction module killer protein
LRGAHALLASSYPIGYISRDRDPRDGCICALVCAAAHDPEKCEAVFGQDHAQAEDREARARILVRIRRLSLGNLGDVKSIGSGASELRIDYGPGYRIYFVQRGKALVILLGGGDKSTQAADIRAALALARTV